MRISDGSSDVCSSDLTAPATLPPLTLASAPTRFNGPYERTVALQARVGNLREQLTIAGTEQAQLLQDRAIHELEGQRQQIDRSLSKARFALQRLYKAEERCVGNECVGACRADW